MGTQWPDGGPWVVVPTGADVDLTTAVTALAAAASVRVAAVVIGGDSTPGEHIATWTALRDDPTRGEAAGLVTTLAATHGLVLVVGTPGLLVPAGRGDWTMTDLAATLGAPVVVVTDDHADAANHTTMALGVLDGRGLAGTVVVVSGTTPDALTDRLPITPAGHLPAAGAGTALTPQTARDLLDPMLHASPPRAPVPDPFALPLRPVSRGMRTVLLLTAVFVTMSVSAVSLAFCDRPAPVADRLEWGII